MAYQLMKGNEAVGYAAIEAGCTNFFGYPITPQSEVSEYLAREMPKHGAYFLQAESEVAAINMIYGAAGTGKRVMTSSSSPGVALMQEGISYIAGAEVPCVLVNMMRGGPGLGSIQPSQTDYWQATRGGGNGDYRLLVLAPASIQELIDLIEEAFDLADKYRIMVEVVGDGMMGQMMESVDLKERPAPKLIDKPWAANGEAVKRGHHNVINSLFLEPDELEEHNKHLQAKYNEIEKNEVRVETVGTEDCDLVLTAYGTVSRICRSAIAELTKEGYKIGLIRPISLWPFPYKAFAELPASLKHVLVVEMNAAGQMIDDVRIGVAGKQEVHFYGRSGGMVPSTEEIVNAARKILEAK